jgi:hypothetical protein
MAPTSEQPAQDPTPQTLRELINQAREDEALRHELGQVVVAIVRSDERYPDHFEAIAQLHLGLTIEKRGGEERLLPPQSKKQIESSRALGLLGIDKSKLNLLTGLNRAVMAAYGIEPPKRPKTTKAPKQEDQPEPSASMAGASDESELLSYQWEREGLSPYDVIRAERAEKFIEKNGHMFEDPFQYRVAVLASIYWDLPPKMAAYKIKHSLTENERLPEDKTHEQIDGIIVAMISKVDRIVQEQSRKQRQD